METSPHPSSSQRHCLILHPQLGTRLLLRQLLTRAGERVVHLCESLRQALWIIGSEQVDFLLSCWQCQDAEGESLLKKLRDARKSQACELVLLNEGLAQADVVRSVKLGVSGIFHAPFTAEGLNELLTQISRQRHPR